MPPSVEVTIQETPKPAAPAAPKPAGDPIPADQLKARAKSALTTLFGEDGTKIADADLPPTVEPAPETPAAPPAEEPSAQAPAPEPEPEAPLTAEELITKAADATGRAVANAMRQQEPEAPKPQPEPEFQVRKDDQRDYEVLQFLANSDPAKWQAKLQEYVAYLRKLYAYEAQWTKEHGEEFDPDSKEHDDFYAQNRPDIDEQDLEDGRVEMKAQKIIDQQVTTKLREMERKEAAVKAAPVIAGKVVKVIHDFVKAVDPSLAKLLQDENGEVNLSKEKVALVRAQDPITADILQELVSREIEPMAIELEKAAIDELDYVIDGSKNAFHGYIDSFRIEKEADLMKLPAEQRRMDGKDFLTVAQYQVKAREATQGAKTQQQKKAALDELESKYWTLTWDQLEELIIHKTAERAKARIKTEDERARAKYGTPSTPQPSAPAPAPAPAPSNGKPRPPSISSQSDLVTSQNSGKPAQKNFADTATDVLFGR